MKIGIDVRCLMQKNYSGVSWYTFNLLKALFAIDQKNEYRLFYNNAKPVIMPEFNQDNVKYVGFNYSNKLFSASLLLFNWPKIDKLISGCDLFFVPNLNFLAWSKNCRKIITVHDLSFLRFPEFFTLEMQFWHKLIFKKKLTEADCLITVSQNTKKDLIEFFSVEPEKIKVVYEGVEEKFKKLTSDHSEMLRVRQKYHLPDKFILFLGTLEPRKNIESIIEAFRLLASDYELVIGGASGWKTKKIYQFAAKQPRIRFLGYLDETDKPVIYNLASLFVYPSYYEGFGLPLLEAMACGCPVICGNNSSQIEVVADAGLLVDPYNLNEIRMAMEIMLYNDKMREGCIRLGLERAKEFSWEKTAQEMLKIFNF